MDLQLIMNKISVQEKDFEHNSVISLKFYATALLYIRDMTIANRVFLQKADVFVGRNDALTAVSMDCSLLFRNLSVSRFFWLSSVSEVNLGMCFL